MIKNRKEYRKSFNSPGQIYLSGELLNFTSYDVSAAGILVEIMPGSILADIKDFEALLMENKIAEIYVKDLMLTGEADIAWAKWEDNKIKLGLEFRNVMNNAEKLWRKRRYYRSSANFSGYSIVDDNRLDYQGVDLSVDGIAIKLAQSVSSLNQGNIIKLIIHGRETKVLGKIIWLTTSAYDSCVLGLRYLSID